ncbi:hypothetical protein [Maricaulis parjimensis]|uniref:hypothetical protein n=1 Tax=Maricaulis parjimensis TaxID=144023 RepID=UPI0019397A33|nr:hypothetical protein [Maricaulis parjimensis]
MERLDQSQYLRWIYRLAFVLLFLTVGYSLGWVLIDLAVRLGLAPSVLWGWDAGSLFRSIGFWQELAFFSSTGLWILCLWLLTRRSALILPVFLAGFVLYRIDSLLLTLNEFFLGVGGVTFSPIIALHLLLILALIQLNAEGVFRRDRGRIPGF